MDNTYKAVFTCEATKERKVWYVSSRHEAQRHLRAHIHMTSGPLYLRYRENDWKFTVKRMFDDTHEVHYDAVGSWGG